MTDYKATPEQWDALEKCSHAWPGAWGPCILELRARVEALEAISKPTPNSSQIGRSLVERVRKALSYPPEPYARAAIREVAAALREQSPLGWAAADWLEQEAER